MPNFNGQGPRWGGGPGAGRGMGPCGSGCQRGGRMRKWFGRFWGGNQNITPEEEKTFLKEEAKNLEAELKEVKEELGKIEEEK
jgi:hypothetical protein